MPQGPWGGLRSSADERAKGGVVVSSAARQDATITCEQCGAVLAFSPGAQELVCRYCGHRNSIAQQAVAAQEQSLPTALQGVSGETLDERPIKDKCAQCGADFDLPPNFFAGDCPFCGTPTVADPTSRRKLPPNGVMPFVIAEPEGRDLIVRWLRGLWFAPSSLANQARKDSRLKGCYIPFWTFDARTRSRYSGQRGDVYYETRWVTVVVNGRQQRQAQQVAKIRWTPVAGQVARDFDDVLVPAGRELPAYLVEKLDPWDTQGMRGYAPDFLRGFRAELYRIPVEEGAQEGRAIMQSVIVGDVRADIGGDQQQIGDLQIERSDETFKLALLPVWVAAFKFLGKDYRVAVNGRTGAVHGERPWSIWKIMGAVVVGLILAAIMLVLIEAANRGGGFG